MAKTVKGGRMRLKRSEVLSASPTIPPNDDHTSGTWLDTDIYIGELFVNTNASTPGIWFRDTGGVTQMATLDKTTSKLPYSQLTSPITKLYSYSFSGGTSTDTPSGGTQYIVVSGISATGTNVYNLELTNLEGSINALFISLNLIINGGSLTININGSSGTILSYSSNTLRGISLMWNGAKWIVVSNTLN